MNLKIGDNIKVSGHYAGYKKQHEFIEGTILERNGVLAVKLKIPIGDNIQKPDITDLACWNNILH